MSKKEVDSMSKTFGVIMYSVSFIIGLVVFFAYSGVRQYGMNVDEATWITVSQWSFQKFFVERDFDTDEWLTLYGTFGLHTPNAAKLVMGSFLSSQGFRLERQCHWDSKLSSDENKTVLSECLGDRLRLARILSSILASVTVSSMFILMITLLPSRWNWVGGLVTCSALFAHQAMREAGRYALIDIYMLFFSTIAFVIQCWWLRFGRRSIASAVGYGSLVGTVIGLAVASKLSGALTAISVVAVAIADYWIRRDKYAVFFASMLIIWPPLIFLAINPQLWPNVWEGIYLMLFHRSIIIDYLDEWGLIHIETLSESLYWFFIRVIWDSIRVASLGNTTPYVVGVISTLLYFAGFLAMIWRSKDTWPFLVYGIITISGTLVWVPTPTLRYYLPAVPFFAFGVGTLTSTLLEKMNASRSDCSSDRGDS